MPNLDFILIDRSGSMRDSWSRVLAAVNSYPTSLQRNFTRSHLVCAAFANNWGLDYTVLRDIPNIAWKPLRTDEISPGGDTPLNDAIVYTCELITDRLGCFEAPDAVSVVVAIISDGGENASEHDLDFTHALMARKRALGWQFVFLGLDFNAEQIARDYGCPVESALNTDIRRLGDSLKRIAEKRKSPGTPLLFDGRDKKDLGGAVP